MEPKFLLALLSSFAFTFLIAPLFINFLYRFNIRRISKVDLDSMLPERSVKFGTPIMGGTLILLTVILALIVFLPHWDATISIILTLVLGGAFGAIDEFMNAMGRRGISVVARVNVDSLVTKSGFVWNLYKISLIPWKIFKEIFRVMGSTQRGLKSHQKFLMHALVAFIGAYFLYFYLGFNTIWLPFIGDVFIGPLYFIFIMFLSLGFAEAFGVTDGMDGLSAGLHTVSFLAYGAIALIFGEFELAILCAVITGAELAFLYFNIHPARVEMSDVGTLPLGMIFVFIAALLKREMMLPIIGGIFAIEILTSVMQQWSAKFRKGKTIFLLAPIHHHFEKLGWHETKVTMRFWLAGAILAFFGILISLL